MLALPYTDAYMDYMEKLAEQKRTVIAQRKHHDMKNYMDIQQHTFFFCQFIWFLTMNLHECRAQAVAISIENSRLSMEARASQIYLLSFNVW